MKARYKKSVLFFGAVVVLILLMASFTTAVQVTNETKEKESVSLDDKVGLDEKICAPFVDSRVKLDSSKIPMLKMALNWVKDEDDKSLINAIVDRLKVKGRLDSEDLKDILLDLEMTSTEIHSGSVYSKAGGNVKALGFPSLFSFGLGPMLFTTWNGEPANHEKPMFEDYIELTINGDSYDQWHTGWAIPSIGFYFSVHIDSSSWGTYWEYTVNLVSPIIIINFH